MAGLMREHDDTSWSLNDTAMLRWTKTTFSMDLDGDLPFHQEFVELEWNVISQKDQHKNTGDDHKVCMRIGSKF